MGINTEKWKNRWSSNEVIVLVLASLGMQIGLIVLAPLRKRITKTWIALTLWLLYLTADAVATLALGNISNQAGGDSETRQGDLTVLWAPFLLLHLGGPDSITSYSVEDNELWWRHLLGLVVQVVITVYIFWQSPPHQWLWIPTIFVFIPGLIKFAERTHALRLGSKDNLKDKIISQINPANDIKKVEELSQHGKKKVDDNHNDKNTTEQGSDPAIKSEDLSQHGKKEGEKEVEDNHKDKVISEQQSKATLRESERESQAICEAYDWFYIFKRLLVDVTFSSNLLMQSQDRFSEMNASEALDTVAIELSFLYDILHTKAVHMHYNFNRVLRVSTMVSIIAALIVFHLLDKQKYASKDIIITYILFGAGLTLEVVAALLLVASDWTVVSLRKKEWRKGIARAITKMVRRVTFMKGKSRWSKTIGQFNLVSLCLRDRDTLLVKIMRIIKIKRIWDNWWETDSISLPEPLLKVMFTEAKRRAQNVHIYKVLVEARAYRGDKTLERHNQLETLNWSMKREFDESIILWHLATDICYYEDETSSKPNGENQEPSHQPCCLKSCLPSKQSNENQEPSHQPDGENQQPSHQPCCLKSCLSSKQSNEKKDTERDVSWKTSNYMIYLLTQQQSMMQLGYGKTRFEATCSVVKKKLNDKGKLKGKEARKELMKHAKNNGAPPVLGQNNALVPADGSQPTNKMGTSVLKKIWANLRCWGRRKREEENNAPVSTDSSQPTNKMVTSEENNAQVSEENNASVSTDSSQPTNKMGTSEENNAQVSEENNARVSTDSSQPTNKMGTSEENNAPVSTDSSQPTNKMGISVLKKIWVNLRWWGTSDGWRCWGKSKSTEEKRKSKKEKLKDQEDMGKAVIADSVRLAKELQAIKPETKKWELISETWMEMLGYAAIHCDSNEHAKSLSRGGELLTHLWLLMSQLGVVDEHKMQQFQSGSGSV